MGENKQLLDTARKSASDWLIRMWNAGYDEGKRKAYAEIENSQDGTTTLSEATEEQKKLFSYFDLARWCDKCEKGIKEGWGFIDFCPYCGRRVVR